MACNSCYRADAESEIVVVNPPFEYPSLMKGRNRRINVSITSRNTLRKKRGLFHSSVPLNKGSSCMCAR
ncbi:unnamed protein product [Dovyalis caffra]|uniref:Uncharacterized protein n=1 Tax=Dovyalis caffra TaxID=77055 RepID=A0AAV1SD30_9ROSI|nr:unnamed protein product [Dovyalis caffra]